VNVVDALRERKQFVSQFGQIAPQGDDLLP
jgi:hypothetical protein